MASQSSDFGIGNQQQVGNGGFKLLASGSQTVLHESQEVLDLLAGVSYIYIYIYIYICKC
jgi:hypothetical protein